MALDLEIVGSVRDVTDEDEIPVARPVAITKLRDSHHALARALAHGQSTEAASLATGYSTSSIARLKTDPSFVELMSHYHQTKEEAEVDVIGRILGCGLDYLQELQARLHENPDSISTSEVANTVKMLVDRAGYAPITRSFNVNKNVGIADQLDRFIKRRRDDAA
jgi:hypothetical protein